MTLTNPLDAHDKRQAERKGSTSTAEVDNKARHEAENTSIATHKGKSVMSVFKQLLSYIGCLEKNLS